jgi:hypothetical protein
VSEYVSAVVAAPKTYVSRMSCEATSAIVGWTRAEGAEVVGRLSLRVSDGQAYEDMWCGSWFCSGAHDNELSDG